MKVWKMKDCFYSDAVYELNKLEKEHAIIRNITQCKDNWYTIFYTVEDTDLYD